MSKLIKFRIFALGLSILAAWALWGCNVNDTPDTTILRMSLPDSLAIENGLYDSVVVDLHDMNDVKTHSAIFSESYEIALDKERLANLKLKTRGPYPFTIHITAYKNKVPLLLLKINLSDKGRVELPVVHLNPNDTGGPPTTPPQSVVITNPPTSVALNMPTPLTMAVTDSPVALSATVLPAGADTSVLWTTSDPLVAEITPDFKVKALKAGKATLTAKSKADPALFATLAVEVIVAVKVDAVSISPKRMTLYTGGADSILTVTMAGTNIDSAKYNLASS